MTTTQVSTLKRKFIEQRTEVLRRKLTSIEAKLFDEIFSKLISQLETSDGKIVSNNQNIDLASALDKIFNSLNKNEYLQAIKVFGSDLIQLQDLNKTYFSIIADDQAKIQKISKDVNSIMAKRIGITTKGELIKNGYLDRLANDASLATKLKNVAYKAISSGEGITTFTEKIKLIAVGNDKVNGGLVKHAEQFAFDTYAQFNRTTSKLYAERLDLRAFIYQGGEIATSRCFCIERDGKVYTTEEAEKWRSKLNKKCGPIMAKDAAYDPITDLGGINCRHSADFISNSLAVRMRPDLAELLGYTSLNQNSTNGELSTERKLLHNEIINNLKSKATPQDNPIVYMNGGGPASGKSAVTSGIVKRPKNIMNIDPDEIKKGLPEYNKMVKDNDPSAATFVHEESSMISKQALKKGVDDKLNVLLDGTGDGTYDDLSAKISKMKANGAKVVADYVSLDTDLAWKLQTARAEKTGRAVPEEYFRRTHENVSTVVPEAIKNKLFDEFRLWDTNLKDNPRLVSEYKDGKFVIYQQDLWNDFLKKGRN